MSPQTQTHTPFLTQGDKVLANLYMLFWSKLISQPNTPPTMPYARGGTYTLSAQPCVAVARHMMVFLIAVVDVTGAPSLVPEVSGIG